MIKLFIFTDAKSTITMMMRRRTDHSLVIGKAMLKALHKLRRAQCRQPRKKRDLSALSSEAKRVEVRATERDYCSMKRL